MGKIYRGKSILYYFSDKKLQYKININDHIITMKSISNKVGILTGRMTIIMLDIEVNLIKNSTDRTYELQ
jgi:hypothetical protein